jgi:hypothetical protein
MVFAPDASIHAARLKKSLDKPLAALLWTEQSRQAEYDRLTALPGVRPGLGAMSGAVVITNADDAATKLAC